MALNTAQTCLRHELSKNSIRSLWTNSSPNLLKQSTFPRGGSALVFSSISSSPSSSSFSAASSSTASSTASAFSTSSSSSSSSFFSSETTKNNFHAGQTEFRESLLSRTLMGSGSVDLKLNEDTGIATVTLNNPDRRNALSGAMMMDLGEVVHELSCWQTGIGVILTGAGDHFCSGGDLKMVKEISNFSDGELMAKYMHGVTTQFYKLPMITVALVRGHAIGGGAELTTACDFRLVEPDARIGFVQSTMGVAPGWGGGTRLVRLLGRKKALELMISARVLPAVEAVAEGLADAIAGEGDDAEEFIRKMVAGKDASVVRAAKMISIVGAEEELEQALEVERALFAAVWGGDAHQRAMRGNIKHKD